MVHLPGGARLRARGGGVRGGVGVPAPRPARAAGPAAARPPRRADRRDRAAGHPAGQRDGLPAQGAAAHARDAGDRRRRTAPRAPDRQRARDARPPARRPGAGPVPQRRRLHQPHRPRARLAARPAARRSASSVRRGTPRSRGRSPRATARSPRRCSTMARGPSRRSRSPWSTTMPDAVRGWRPRLSRQRTRSRRASPATDRADTRTAGDPVGVAGRSSRSRAMPAWASRRTCWGRGCRR